MKITVAEWKEFYETPDDEWYALFGTAAIMEGGLVDEDGNEIYDFDNLDPKKMYDVVGLVESDTMEYGIELDAAVRKWRKSRKSQTFVITVPKDDIDALKALALEHKWKVK